MGKVRKKRYFRIPLSLISATDDVKELAGLTYAHGVVTRGSNQLKKLIGEHWNELDELEMISELEEVLGVEDAWPKWLPRDFNRNDWRHRAAFVAFAPVKRYAGEDSEHVGGLDLPPPIKVAPVAHWYDRAEAHVKDVERRAGRRSPHVDVGEQVYDAMVEGTMSYREVCILLSVYSCVAGRGRRPRALSARDLLRYRADGFGGREAFANAQASAAVEPMAGVIDASVLESHHVELTEAQGWYRYDRADAIMEALGYTSTGVGLTDEGSIFTPHATTQGVLFRLDHEARMQGVPGTGQRKASAIYQPGQRVVYVDHEATGQPLRIGVVSGFTAVRVVIDTEGERREVRRVDGKPVPLRLVPELEAAAQAAMGQSKAPQPRWTARQIGSTLTRLHDLGWFVRVHDGRSWHYGVGMTHDELEAAVIKKKAYRQERRHEDAVRKERIKLKQEIRSADQAEELAELRRQREEAKRRKSVASVSGARSNSVSSASAPGRNDVASTSPIIEVPLTKSSGGGGGGSISSVKRKTNGLGSPDKEVDGFTSSNGLETRTLASPLASDAGTRAGEGFGVEAETDVTPPLRQVPSSATASSLFGTPAISRRRRPDRGQR